MSYRSINKHFFYYMVLTLEVAFLFLNLGYSWSRFFLIEITLQFKNIYWFLIIWSVSSKKQLKKSQMANIANGGRCDHLAYFGGEWPTWLTTPRRNERATATKKRKISSQRNVIKNRRGKERKVGYNPFGHMGGKIFDCFTITSWNWFKPFDAFLTQ